MESKTPKRNLCHIKEKLYILESLIQWSSVKHMGATIQPHHHHPALAMRMPVDSSQPVQTMSFGPLSIP